MSYKTQLAEHKTASGDEAEPAGSYRAVCGFVFDRC